MKIGLDVNRVLNVYNNNSKTEKAKNSKPASKDQIEISTVGRELSKYVEMAKNSDLTDKRVDEIKKQISNNQYKVDSSNLARTILEFMKDSDK